MRYFFSYQFGYINIDTHNLYLTHSGNWSEIIDLNEKPFHHSVHGSFKRSLTLVMFILVLCLLLFLAASTYGSYGLSIRLLLLIALTTFGVYKLYHYFRQEMGNRFFVPLEKLQSVAYENGGIKISFLDKNNEPDSEFLQGVDQQTFEKIALITGKHPGLNN